MSTGDVPVLQLLGAHIAGASSLQVLDLRGNGLARASLQVIEACITRLDSLEALDLGSNRISGAVMNGAAAHIAAAGAALPISASLCACYVITLQGPPTLVVSAFMHRVYCSQQA